MSRPNPFDDPLAVENSCYTAFQNDQLVLLHDPEQPPPKLAQFAHSQFRNLVLAPQFTCLGARAAVKHATYRFGMYGPIGSPEATAGLCRDLFTFVDEQLDMGGIFSTFIASFSGPNPTDEEHFERLVWDQLQSLHDRDSRHHAWDPAVAADPDDPSFSFSFAGRGFVVVGLHAGSSRWTRRFAWPTLAFNATFQFTELDASGKSEQFRHMIRVRDIELQGTINATLAMCVIEQLSGARLISGRAVERDWQCPLHVHEHISPPEPGE